VFFIWILSYDLEHYHLLKQIIFLLNKVIVECLLFGKYRMEPQSLLHDHYDVGHRSYAMAVENKVICLLNLLVFNYVLPCLCLTKLFVFNCRS